MMNQTSDNVIEFPREYLLEQRQRERWLTIAACSIVMGSDDGPSTYVRMILDKFGDAPNQKPTAADIIVHTRFAAKAIPHALLQPDRFDEATSGATEENVYNEWIDAWLPAHPC